MFEDAEIISCYTRQQAIEDGVLVQLSGPGYQGDDWVPAMCAEAGFKWPIACTAEVFNDCIALTPKAEVMCNDIKGRLWDVLWMLTMAIRSSRQPGTELIFSLRCVRHKRRADLVRLKSVTGPGDDGEPVITIMYPEQD